MERVAVIKVKECLNCPFLNKKDKSMTSFQYVCMKNPKLITDIIECCGLDDELYRTIVLKEWFVFYCLLDKSKIFKNE